MAVKDGSHKCGLGMITAREPAVLLTVGCLRGFQFNDRDTDKTYQNRNS